MMIRVFFIGKDFLKRNALVQEKVCIYRISKV